MAQKVCHACGAAVTYDEPIPRDGECAKCGGDLRCCRNCRHWDVRYGNECTETQAEPVEDKTRRNFCEFFYYSREPFTGGPDAARDRAAEARAKLEALFGERRAGEAESVPGPRGPSRRAGAAGKPEAPGGVGSTGASSEPDAGQPVSPPPAAQTRADIARANLEKLFRKPPEEE